MVNRPCLARVSTIALSSSRISDSSSILVWSVVKMLVSIRDEPAPFVEDILVER